MYSDRDWFSAKGVVVCVQMQPVSVPERSVRVYMLREGFQHCLVYCLLPPRLVYLAVLQLSVLSRILYNHKDPLHWTTSACLLICHCLHCNQSCYQFVTKHTLMSFITSLWYFVSWSNYNDQTCFPSLDAVISELLTTASAHISRHIWPERKVIMCATFVVYVRSIKSFDIDLCLCLVCSSGRNPSSTVKGILWVAVWNRIKWQEMGFSYLR